MSSVGRPSGVISRSYAYTEFAGAETEAVTVCSAGSLMSAWYRAGASKVILAVPVAPAEGIRRLAAEADEVRVLATPEQFYAVGQWYRDFDQVSDQEVVSLLQSAPS